MLKVMDRKRGFTLVEIMIVLAIIGLIVSIAVPAFLKNRRDAQGSACNGQLDSIFSALEQIAFKKNAKPGMTLATTTDEIDSYLRGVSVTDDCPIGGTYVAPLASVVDANGQVIVPTCDQYTVDGGGGVLWEAQGLHIHRRSYLQDPTTGVYSRNGDITFAS
jgi:prepilin-type N-terminal cleavage/methylation domain-containing protein